MKYKILFLLAIFTAVFANREMRDFQLISPEPDYNSINFEKNIEFKWQSAAGIDGSDVSYKLFLTKGNDTGVDTLTQMLTDTVYAFNGENFFEDYGRYYWTVWAFEGEDSLKTTSQGFTFDILNTVDRFRLLSPANDSLYSASDKVMNFSWEDAEVLNEGTIDYKLFLRTGYPHQDTVLTNISDTNYNFDGNDWLLNGWDYFWTVYAYNGTDSIRAMNGDWSFSVKDTLSVFDLLSPEKGTVNLDKQLDFAWESSDYFNTEDVSYKLNIYTADGTQDTIVYVNDIFYNFDGKDWLDGKSTYYWNVYSFYDEDSLKSKSTFNVVSRDTLNEFYLITPEFDSDIVDSEILFSWSDAFVDGYEDRQYKLQIEQISEMKKDTIISLTETSYDFNGKGWFEDFAKYAWGVFAYNGNDSLAHLNDYKWLFEYTPTIDDLDPLPYKTSKDLISPNVIRLDVEGMESVRFKPDPQFTSIKIFTTQGRFVEKLKKRSDGIFVWYGHNKNNVKVEPGVYLYQISHNGDVIRNGFIGVVR